MRINKKLAVVAAVTGVVALGAGTAYAYWTTTGGGSGVGSATAGSTNVITVSDNFASLVGMYPGDAAQTLKVKAKNDTLDSASYKVQAVKAYITTNKAGCTGDDFLLNGAAATSTVATAQALNWTAVELAAGVTSSTVDQTIHFNNTSANQDACKGAAVTINYLAS